MSTPTPLRNTVTFKAYMQESEADPARAPYLAKARRELQEFLSAPRVIREFENLTYMLTIGYHPQSPSVLKVNTSYVLYDQPVLKESEIVYAN